MPWLEQRMVGMVLVYGWRLWIVWTGTSCTVWDGGWNGKVPGVRVVFVEIMCKVHVAHDHEHDYHDKLHSVEVAQL
jgi:hypothetical protein